MLGAPTPRFYPAWGWALGQGPLHSVLSPPANPVPSWLLSFHQRRVLASYTTPLTPLSTTASSKPPGLYSQPRFLFSHPEHHSLPCLLTFLVCPSIHLFSHPFVYLFVHPSTAHRVRHKFIYLLVYLTVHSFIYLFLHHPFSPLSTCPSSHLYIYISSPLFINY